VNKSKSYRNKNMSVRFQSLQSTVRPTDISALHDIDHLNPACFTSNLDGEPISPNFIRWK